MRQTDYGSKFQYRQTCVLKLISRIKVMLLVSAEYLRKLHIHDSTLYAKCHDITSVVIWHYINKTDLTIFNYQQLVY